MQMTSNLQSDQHLVSPDNQNLDIQNHRRAATFLAKAARLHLEAAKQRLEGNLEKVAECTLVAQDLLLRVAEMQKDDMRRLELN